MRIKDFIIRAFKRSYRFVVHPEFNNPECCIDRTISNKIIYDLLKSGKPCMISRFGTTEINCINNYLCVSSKRSFLLKCLDYIRDKTHTPWWNVEHFHTMHIYSGIFPETEDTAVNFSKRYIEDIPEIDVLGCHQYYEKFMPLKDSVIRLHLECLYPFFVDNPWTMALTGKNVLVIHPFCHTIQEQYTKRYNLFDNKNILPDFNLITMAAVQTVAGEPSEFSSWFEALAYMEDKIKNIDFDVAIIGCGAYGLPLAAFIKRLGKQAIHLAGGTQLLFGIKGARWDNPHYGDEYGIKELFPPYYCSLYNDYWTKAKERPKNSDLVENSCYW